MSKDNNMFCESCKSKVFTSEMVNGVKKIHCTYCNEESFIGIMSESKYCLDCCEKLSICSECEMNKN